MTNPKDLVGAKKAPLGVVPPALMLGAAPAMQVGADKYGPFNWRGQPVQVMTYIEAIQRHLFAFTDGQDNAEDTGISHLGHAAASLGILMDAFALSNVIDNRPPPGAAPAMLRAQDHSAYIVDAIQEATDNMMRNGATLADHIVNEMLAVEHPAMPLKARHGAGLTHTPTKACNGVHTEDRPFVLGGDVCPYCGVNRNEHSIACFMFGSGGFTP